MENELIDVGAFKYRVGNLSAMQQFHIVRKLAPVLSGVADAMKGLSTASTPDTIASEISSFDKIAQAVSSMSHQDSEYVIKICLAACHRHVPGGGLARLVQADGTLSFADMKLADMLQLAWRVLQGSLSDFFPVVPPISPADPAQR